MARKPNIAITIDEAFLRVIDDYISKQNASSTTTQTNRSKLIEDALRMFLSPIKSDTDLILYRLKQFQSSLQALEQDHRYYELFLEMQAQMLFSRMPPHKDLKQGRSDFATLQSSLERAWIEGQTTMKEEAVTRLFGEEAGKLGGEIKPSDGTNTTSEEKSASGLSAEAMHNKEEKPHE